MFIILCIIHLVYGIISEKIEAELYKIDNRLYWWIFLDPIYDFLGGMKDDN